MTDTDKIIEKLDAILNQMEKLHETMLVIVDEQDIPDVVDQDPGPGPGGNSQSWIF